MYKIIGADQKEYGPVEAEELRAWIAGGRANGSTLAQVEGGAWKPLSTFPEFAPALSVPPQPLSLAQAAGVARPRQTNNLAVAGLVMGILSVTFGLFCCVPLFSIPGILCSVMALSQIQRNPELQTGRGMATAGLVLSVLGLMGSVVPLMVFASWRHFMESLKTHGG